MTDDELKTWAALAEKATPGPWSSDPEGIPSRRNNDSVGYLNVVDVIVTSTRDEDTHHVVRDAFVDDAAFIAAARTAVPALIAEVRRLKGAHETLRKAADAFVYVGDISGPGAQSVYNEALSTLLPLLKPTP